MAKRQVSRNVSKQWSKGGLNALFIENFLKSTNQPKAFAIMYLLHVLGGTLFVDKSKSRISPSYIPYLVNIHKAKEYAWGAATLASLYKELGMASNNTTKSISMCLSLLQAWIYEYFPKFAPDTNSFWNDTFPRCFKWKPTKVNNKDKRLLRMHRKELDALHAREVTWTPFHPTPGTAVPISLYRGMIHCRDISQPYMPDRVLRQFGYTQTIPSEPLATINLAQQPATLCDFKEYQKKLINPAMFTTPACPSHNEDANYLRWYQERTYVFLTPKIESRPQTEESTSRSKVLQIASLVSPFTEERRERLTREQYMLGVTDAVEKIICLLRDDIA